MNIKYTLTRLGSLGLLMTSLFSSPVVTADANLAAKNLAAGQKFLADNQHQTKVQVLPSGLQYRILHEGEGQSPSPTDFVTVHYRGRLIDGMEFDSSHRHNAPATFAVNAVIPGWTEALQLMKPGAKWTVYIPPQLAYGTRGVGRLIGPNATLIFDIELIAVKPAVDDSQDTLDDFEDEG